MDDDIHLYKGYDWADYGKKCLIVMDIKYQQFVDFEAYGRLIGDYYTEEYENGIIEICA